MIMKIERRLYKLYFTIFPAILSYPVITDTFFGVLGFWIKKNILYFPTQLVEDQRK